MKNLEIEFHSVETGSCILGIEKCVLKVNKSTGGFHFQPVVPETLRTNS